MLGNEKRLVAIAMTLIALLGVIGVVVVATIVSAPLVENKQGQLIFSHVLYRHGDRMPAHTYPNDPHYSYSDSEQPVNLGALTHRGMQQLFDLGKWMRQRYGNVLLSDTYTPNEIYVRSSDTDRTLQSGLVNMAGLYPPLTDQVWNADLLWQPIPVHTVNYNQDWMLATYVPPCPVYDLAMLDLDVLQEFQNVYNDSRQLMEYAAQHSGYEMNIKFSGLENMAILRDILHSQEQNNLILPEWTKAIYPSAELSKLALLYYKAFSYTPQLAKIRIGYLFKEILDRSEGKYNKILSPNVSVYVYSTHDMVLHGILNAMKISNTEFIEYAAALLFEIRSTSTGPTMEIYMKMSSRTDEATPLYIPECGFSCPLSKLNDLYANIIPTEDFATICQL